MLVPDFDATRGASPDGPGVVSHNEDDSQTRIRDFEVEVARAVSRQEHRTHELEACPLNSSE